MSDEKASGGVGWRVTAEDWKKSTGASVESMTPENRELAERLVKRTVLQPPVTLVVSVRDARTGQTHTFEQDGWIPTEESPDGGAIWMFTEGNFGCDCNLTLFLARAGVQGYVDHFADRSVPRTPCGENLRVTKIVQKDTGEVWYGEVFAAPDANQATSESPPPCR